MTARMIDGRVVICNAVPASSDATGRPGNVFNHAALLTSPAPVDLRPIDFRRSEGWCTPFGAAAAARARIRELRPGVSCDRAAVVRFLKGGECIFTLEWLLAVFSEVRLRRGTLVLLVGSADEGAAWIAALSHVTTGVEAQSWTWSTFERADAVADLVRRRATIIAVPRSDADLLGDMSQGATIVVDTDWDVSEAEDGSWPLPTG